MIVPKCMRTSEVYDGENRKSTMKFSEVCSESAERIRDHHQFICIIVCLHKVEISIIKHKSQLKEAS